MVPVIRKSPDTRRQRVRWVALAVTGALLSSACTDGSNDASPGPTTSKTSRLDPITIEREPLWRGSTGRSQTPESELRGDSLLIYGNTEDEFDRVLIVADAATGGTRWRLDNYRNLPGDDRAKVAPARDDLLPVIVGTDDDWTTFVPYTTDCFPDDVDPDCIPDPSGQAEYGIAALSGADGSVRWKAPVHVESPLIPMSHNVVAADDKTVVSAVASDPVRLDDPTQVRTFATDVASGARLWESSGIWPQFVVGDTVLGQVGRKLALPRDIGPDDGSAVAALDAKTGTTKWSIADRYPESKVYQTLGDVAVISTPGDPRSNNYRSFAIDVSTGNRIAALGDSDYCLSDQDSLIMCPISRKDTVVTFDVDKRESGRGTLAPPSTQIHGAWHGYFFLSDSVVDRYGAVVTDELPGIVIALSEKYVILYDSRAEEYAAYRRTG